MINFDDYANENKPEQILIKDIDKIYLYAKDPYELNTDFQLTKEKAQD